MIIQHKMDSEEPHNMQVKCRLYSIFRLNYSTLCTRGRILWKAQVDSPEKHKQRDGESLGTNEEKKFFCSLREVGERIWNSRPYGGEGTERTTSHRRMNPVEEVGNTLKMSFKVLNDVT